MGPAAKIALGGALGGLMVTIAVIAELRATARPAATIEEPPSTAAGPPHIPARCRIITMPDSGCDAAWEASRRHFFGEDQAR